MDCSSSNCSLFQKLAGLIPFGQTLSNTNFSRFQKVSGKCRRREAAIAEGKKPLTTIGGLWERRKLPQRGLGRSTDADAIFNILCKNRVHFSMLINLLLFFN